VPNGYCADASVEGPTRAVRPLCINPGLLGELPQAGWQFITPLWLVGIGLGQDMEHFRDYDAERIACRPP
jgi:hypothetical protein